MAKWFGMRVLLIIQRSRDQGLHPVTSGICFSVVLSSNPRSHFVNGQLVSNYLLPVEIFNCFIYLKYFFLCFNGMPVN